MFDAIVFYIYNKSTQLGGQSFLLGELSKDILNIPREEYLRMKELCERIESASDPFDRRVAAEELRRILLKRKLFRILAGTSPPPGTGRVLTDDALMELGEFPPPEPTTEDQLRLLYRQLPVIVGHIFAFHAMTAKLIDGPMSRLDKLSPERFAYALHQLDHDAAAMKLMTTADDPDMIYRTHSPIEVQFLSREIPGQPGTYAIFEYYHVKGLQDFLKLDYHRALLAGHSIRRCKRCGLFFLQQDARHTRYCDRPMEDRPGWTCRKQMSTGKDRDKEKAENNPVIRSHTRAKDRVRKDWERGLITTEELELARRHMQNIRSRGISGKLRDHEVEEQMQKKRVYDELGIVRKGGRK